MVAPALDASMVAITGAAGDIGGATAAAFGAAGYRVVWSCQKNLA